MLRFSYETLTNSWFYGEWIVKIIAKVMILIIHFVLRKKRRETMKDDKKEKSEQRYMERIRLIKDRVVNTRPEMDLENAKIMTESFKETAGEPLCIRKAKAFRRQCREKTVKIWDQELIVGGSGMITNEIAGEMFTFIANEIESYRSKFGTMTPGILPVSGNTPFGLEVGALPSGRHAWKPLADEVSPNGGTDTEGPGAVLKSVSHLPHDRFVQGTLLNMKIEPEMLNSENGIMQMMALLKSMCSLGIFHVQFNVIDRETLLAAQERPEEYRGLLIRVAGYTAYFTELGKDVQDEIIARTEQESLYGCSVE